MLGETDDDVALRRDGHGIGSQEGYHQREEGEAHVEVLQSSFVEREVEDVGDSKGDGRWESRERP